MKSKLYCWSCNKEYDSTEVKGMKNVKCECGGYIITPSGKVKARITEEKEDLMKVYKVCFDGNWCAFDRQIDAIDMIMCEAECNDDISDEDYEKIQEELKQIDVTKDISYSCSAGYSIKTDTMTQKEFYDLPEFEGF